MIKEGDVEFGPAGEGRVLAVSAGSRAGVDKRPVVVVQVEVLCKVRKEVRVGIALYAL